MFAIKFTVPTNKTIDSRLIIGSSLFGIGWGISGLCPGPGIINALAVTHAVIWFGGFCVGQLIFYAYTKNSQDIPEGGKKDS